MVIVRLSCASKRKCTLRPISDAAVYGNASGQSLGIAFLLTAGAGLLALSGRQFLAGAGKADLIVGKYTPPRFLRIGAQHLLDLVRGKWRIVPGHVKQHMEHAGKAAVRPHRRRVNHVQASESWRGGGKHRACVHFGENRPEPGFQTNIVVLKAQPDMRALGNPPIPGALSDDTDEIYFHSDDVCDAATSRMRKRKDALGL